MLKVSSLSLCLMLPTMASAALNDTGQTQCFDGAELVACSAKTAGDAAEYPRQDGRFGRDTLRTATDVQLLDSSGQDVSSAYPACVADRHTGLTWEVLPDNVPRAATPWDGAAALARTLSQKGYCGRHDWRVPTHSELQSIVNYGRLAPAIEPAVFTDGASGAYWTADSFAPKPEQAWTIQFIDGNSKPAGKETEQRVRLVSGNPQAGPTPLTIQPDATILDPATGLIWDRCSIGQTGEDCGQGKAQQLSWHDALRASVEANKLRYKGKTDWRVPNVKELLSISDMTKYRPAIDTTSFPQTASDWYWSSTPRAGDDGKMWDIGFDDGHIGYGIEDLRGYVRLVRNASEPDALSKARVKAKPVKK